MRQLRQAARLAVGAGLPLPLLQSLRKAIERIDELVARINSFLRRRKKISALTTAVPARRALFGDWSFDPATLTATHRNGRREMLSAAEAELLLGLLQSPRQILSREQLMQARQGAFDRCIDVRMSRIRKKLEQDPRNPQLIRTVYGAGYMLMADVQWQAV